MKKYWHQLDIQDLDVIQRKTRKYLEMFGLIKKPGFQPLEWNFFIRFVPEIEQAFEHLNLNVFSLNAFIMLNNQDGPPHQDPTDIAIRCNIPILNTENTYTCFYELNNPEQEIVAKYHNNIPYYSYSYDEIHLVDKCVIDTATLIRPKEIHSIEFSQLNPVPRITLTAVLDPIPYEYFPDIGENERRPLKDLVGKEWSKYTVSKPYQNPKFNYY